VIDARFGFSKPERLWEVGGRLLFIVYNDPNRRHELWTSDGTREGTVMVREVHSRTWTDFSCQTVRAGGALYFLARDKKKGNELWKSDCSPEGTQMVIGEARPVLDAAVRSRRVTGLARIGETVFADVGWLVSDPGSRTGLSRVKGLARTDGTRDGTYLMWQRRREAPRPERRIEIPHPIGFPPSGRQ
jgi:ELWxxDGT repeat protein